MLKLATVQPEIHLLCDMEEMEGFVYQHELMSIFLNFMNVKPALKNGGFVGNDMTFWGFVPNPSSTVRCSHPRLTLPGHPWCSRRRHKRRWVQASIIWHWIRELESGKIFGRLRYFNIFQANMVSWIICFHKSVHGLSNKLKRTW